MSETKICPKCKREHPLTEEFFNYRAPRDAWDTPCKLCKKEKYEADRKDPVKLAKMREWNSKYETSGKRAEQIKNYKSIPVEEAQNPSEKIKCIDCGNEYPKTLEFFAYRKERSSFLPRCRECHKIWFRKYNEDKKHLEKLREANKRLRSSEQYREYEKERKKEYSQRPEVKQHCAKKAAIRRRDPRHKLGITIGSALRKALKGGKSFRKFEDVVGYTKQHLEDFIKKENRLEDGITWDMYITNTKKNMYDIDHLIPQDYYDETDPEQIKKCWAMRNLRIMKASANRSRHERFIPELIEKYGIEDLLPECLTEQYNQYKISNQIKD